LVISNKIITFVSNKIKIKQMKKIMTICLMALLSLTACEKQETPVKKEKVIIYKTVYFTGTPSVKAVLSVNGVSTIDGVKFGLNQPIKVKKGDRLSFVDQGVDFQTEPEFILYNYYGPGQNYVKPAVWEQGFTYGAIVVDNLIMKTSQGQDDVNLYYTVE
jgi:hypothetical protein